MIFCPAKRNFFAPVLLEYKIIYPDMARQMGLEGKVILGVLINETGNVEKVRILKSSSSILLDSAALKTAYTFKFSPAMMGNRPVRTWVNMPVEFKFEEVKPEEWLIEVRALQKSIAQDYKEEMVVDLYKLYKKLIFSPKKAIEIKVNDYIKLAVLNKTAKLWDGYWKLYPATPILFFDIIYRYPDSYARFEAEEDFKKFFEQEVITIRSTLPQTTADTIILRLKNALELP
uniref:Energy transducer TonB n=1 Tax=candidate division WOR-3 bacterium TaxID=2052148 RepID=A0A7V0Z515_UNCW3